MFSFTFLCHGRKITALIICEKLGTGEENPSSFRVDKFLYEDDNAEITKPGHLEFVSRCYDTFEESGAVERRFIEYMKSQEQDD